MTEENGPVAGNWYNSPINAWTTFADIRFPNFGLRIANHVIEERGGEVWPVLGYQATTFETTWELVYMKMETFVTGLAMGSFSNCWLSDYIYDDRGKQVWRKPGTVELVPENEGDPLNKLPTNVAMTTLMLDLALHAAMEYPRVLLYHHIGLLLLRTPLVGYHVHAEVLLLFFKIAELIVTKRTGQKANLKIIQQVCEELGSGWDAGEIRNFYIVRSRDAAHDHAQAENVTRATATACKLWAEQLLFMDWKTRGVEAVKRK